MDIKTPKRIFRYKELELKDPNPRLSIDEVKKHYSALYPEIINANVEKQSLEDTDDGKKVLILKLSSSPGRLG